VAAATEHLEKHGLSAAMMIDASHDNSHKDHRRQPEVFREILRQRTDGGNAQIVAAMVESNLEEGNQPLRGSLEELRYGQSITDKCIDWETTEVLVREAYARL
jgi:3-deoxy-7-phosphoheptulonate synthase